MHFTGTKLSEVGNYGSTLMKKEEWYLGYAMRAVMKEQRGAKWERSRRKRKNERWGVKI